MLGPADCNSKKIFFGFESVDTDMTQLDRADLYSCTSIDGNLINNVGGAYRVVTLDREVEGITPLSVDDSGVQVGDEVYSIAHSHGLALKVTTANVWESTPEWNRFRAGLSAIRGSESGPIFSGQTGRVIGVQTSNLNSGVRENPYRGCRELKICEQEDCFLEILAPASMFSRFAGELN